MQEKKERPLLSSWGKGMEVWLRLVEAVEDAGGSEAELVDFMYDRSPALRKVAEKIVQTTNLFPVTCSTRSTVDTCLREVLKVCHEAINEKNFHHERRTDIKIEFGAVELRRIPQFLEYDSLQETIDKYLTQGRCRLPLVYFLSLYSHWKKQLSHKGKIFIPFQTVEIDGVQYVPFTEGENIDIISVDQFLAYINNSKNRDWYVAVGSNG